MNKIATELVKIAKELTRTSSVQIDVDIVLKTNDEAESCYEEIKNMGNLDWRKNRVTGTISDNKIKKVMDILENYFNVNFKLKGHQQ